MSPGASVDTPAKRPEPGRALYAGNGAHGGADRNMSNGFAPSFPVPRAGAPRTRGFSEQPGLLRPDADATLSRVSEEGRGGSTRCRGPGAGPGSPRTRCGSALSSLSICGRGRGCIDAHGVPLDHDEAAVPTLCLPRRRLAEGQPTLSRRRAANSQQQTFRTCGRADCLGLADHGPGDRIDVPRQSRRRAGRAWPRLCMVGAVPAYVKGCGADPCGTEPSAFASPSAAPLTPMPDGRPSPFVGWHERTREMSPLDRGRRRRDGKRSPAVVKSPSPLFRTNVGAPADPGRTGPAAAGPDSLWHRERLDPRPDRTDPTMDEGCSHDSRQAETPGRPGGWCDHPPHVLVIDERACLPPSQRRSSLAARFCAPVRPVIRAEQRPVPPKRLTRHGGNRREGQQPARSGCFPPYPASVRCRNVKVRSHASSAASRR